MTMLLVILGGYGSLMSSYLTGNSSSASSSSDLTRSLLPGLSPYWTPPHTTPSLPATESMYIFYFTCIWSFCYVLLFPLAASNLVQIFYVFFFSAEYKISYFL